MRKSFLVLIFLFFTFSILNAKPLKTEAELQNIRNKADKIVQEELKNDYKKEYLKRKNNFFKKEVYFFIFLSKYLSSPFWQ